MRSARDLKKICAFGLIGTLGCLAGWVLGEGFLAVALPRAESEHLAPSLASIPADIVLTPVSQAVPPSLQTTQYTNFVADLPPPTEQIQQVAETEVPAAFEPTSQEPAPPPAVRDVASEVAPPPPAEFKTRLERFGAKTGDIQISLIWNNINDIDLACVDPNGEEIFFRNRLSRSGGMLDVDKNADPRRLIVNPVENIFWQTGRAPYGRYRIYVNHYANHGAADPTDYEVNILSGVSRKNYRGKITFGDSPILIEEFTFGPTLQMAVPERIEILPGGASQMQITVARKKYKGPVSVHVEGDLRGLKIEPVDLPENRYQALLTLQADARIESGERELVVVTKGSNDWRGEGKVIVHIKPTLRLAAAPEPIVHPGVATGIGVRIARGGFSGPVKLRVAGEIDGLTFAPLEIPGDKETGTLDVTIPATTSPGRRRIKLIAEGGTVAAEADVALKLEPIAPELHVSAATTLRLTPDSAVRLGVRVLRVGSVGEVRLAATGDLRGLKIAPIAIASDKNIASLLVSAEPMAELGERNITITATSGALTKDHAVKVRIDPIWPMLFVTASPEVSIIPGTKNVIRVRIVRVGVTGPVRLRLEGDLAGLRFDEVEMAEDRQDAILEFSADPNGDSGKRALKVVGRAGKVTGDTTFELDVKDLRPALHVAISPEIVVTPGTSSPVPLRIARERFHGPVEVFVEGVVPGVHIARAEIPDGAELAELSFQAATSAFGKHRSRIVARSGRFTTAMDFDIVVPEQAAPQFSWWLALTIGVWTGLLAIGFATAVAVAQTWYLSRRWPSVRQLLGVVAAGMVAGILAGGIGQSLFNLLDQFHIAPELGFVVGWGILGGLSGRGVGFFIPNLNGRSASLAGMLGGLLGAGAFIGVSSVGDFAGRCVGAAILGCSMGLVVAIVEAAFRIHWLEVVYGGNEMRMVNLGAEPIRIGNGSSCNIWTRTDQTVALRFWVDQGRITRHHVADDVTSVIEHGHRERVGTLEIKVCSGRVAGSISNLGSALAKPAAPPPPPPAAPLRPKRASASKMHSPATNALASEEERSESSTMVGASIGQASSANSHSTAAHSPAAMNAGPPEVTTPAASAGAAIPSVADSSLKRPPPPPPVPSSKRAVPPPPPPPPPRMKS